MKKAKDRKDTPLSHQPPLGEISVIVADPYPIIVQGLRKIVEDDPRFRVVAEASTMASFRKKVLAQRPQVALVDWPMAAKHPDMMRELLQSSLLRLSVIFLTITETTHEKREMTRSGACTVLNKWSSARKLHKAIYKACEGSLIGHESGTGIARPHPSTIVTDADAESARIRELTKREHQILALVCDALRNKEIAERLGISETTVWHHLTSIFNKLGVEDRLALAAFGFRHRSTFEGATRQATGEKPGKG